MIKRLCQTGNTQLRLCIEFHQRSTVEWSHHFEHAWRVVAWQLTYFTSTMLRALHGGSLHGNSLILPPPCWEHCMEGRCMATHLFYLHHVESIAWRLVAWQLTYFTSTMLRALHGGSLHDNSLILPPSCWEHCMEGRCMATHLLYLHHVESIAWRVVAWQLTYFTSTMLRALHGCSLHDNSLILPSPCWEHCMEARCMATHLFYLYHAGLILWSRRV